MLTFLCSNRFTDSSRTILQLVYSASNFDLGGVFELVLNLTDFTTRNGSGFANAVQRGYTYQMASMDCNDHGKANITDGKIVCYCEKEYAGQNCENCASGYHRKYNVGKFQPRHAN